MSAQCLEDGKGFSSGERFSNYDTLFEEHNSLWYPIGFYKIVQEINLI